LTEERISRPREARVMMPQTPAVRMSLGRLVGLFCNEATLSVPKKNQMFGGEGDGMGALR
jgi:hypothetical protein